MSKQKEKLDRVITNAAKRFYAERCTTSTFSYDVGSCSKEMWALAGSSDLCYDRPSIGFCYSLWYHGNRVSSLLGIFEAAMLNRSDEQPIHIYDLGAGTGAVQWAVALIYSAMRDIGIPTVPIRIINVDSSPFMLEYNQNYLWKEFLVEYPSANEIGIDFSLNNWINHNEGIHSNNWICASYVFDHNESKDVLAREFKQLVSRIRPSRVLLFTSLQAIQITHLQKVVQAIEEEGYIAVNLFPRKFFYEGILTEVNRFRKEVQTNGELGFSGQVTWNRSYFYCRLLSRSQATLPLKIDEIKIYQAPQAIRSKISLTDQQRKATISNNQPTIIIGPAGCGKSVVLTERIRKVIEEDIIPYNPELRILVTSFNKKLVKVLSSWLADILDAKRCKQTFYSWTANWGKTYYKDHSHFTFIGSQHSNIEILHFDVLPTIIGSIKTRSLNSQAGDYDSFHRTLMKECVDKYFILKGYNRDEHQKISDVDFLMDEFERIVYGFQIKSRKEYLFAERIGRGNNPTLQYGTLRRQIVYDCIFAYLKCLQGLKVENFQIRRSKLLQKIKTGQLPPIFTHIFVDEFQDCTKADHEIFQGLLKNPNNLVLAGDLAQSIQLGAASHVPAGEEMRRFKHQRLEGSFRLPFRISECLKPLSVKINRRYGSRNGVEPDVIIPYSGAQPGSRPVVVYALDSEQMAGKLSEVIKAYSIYNLATVSLFERDHDLRDKLKDKGIHVENDLILKYKGLEFPCVIWSSRIIADTKLEQEEFAYTIFTRTSGVLIIAAFKDIDARLKDILKIFLPSRSNYWDQETSDFMVSLIGEEFLTDDLDSDLTNQINVDIEERESLDDLILD